MTADDNTPRDSAAESQIMNYLVRMVVPMRREFGRGIDVTQFLHDVAYANDVMQQALSSQDPRLRDYANYVQQRYHGPRVASSAPPAAAPSAQRTASSPADEKSTSSAADKLAAEEAELRARMMKKYTDGLR